MRVKETINRKNADVKSMLSLLRFMFWKRVVKIYSNLGFATKSKG